MLPNTNCRLKSSRIYGEGQGGLFIIYEVLNGRARAPALALVGGRAGSALPRFAAARTRAGSHRVWLSYDAHASGRNGSIRAALRSFREPFSRGERGPQVCPKRTPTPLARGGCGCLKREPPTPRFFQPECERRLCQPG